MRRFMEKSYFKKLGFHIRPTNQLLVECLKKKVRMVSPTADFPIVDRDLYSADPWALFRDDDPWDIEETSDESSFVRRSIFVYAKLNLSGKRCKRTTNNGTWNGRTAEEPITVDDGRERPEYGNNSNFIIGSKMYLEFKAKNDSEGTRHRHGHWTMHQIKLAGESLKGLEGINCSAAALQEAANVQVLCTITQKVEKDSPAYCTWPKGTILDEYLEEYLRLGYFTPAVGGTHDLDHHQEAEKSSVGRPNSSEVVSYPVVAAGGSRKRKFPASSTAAGADDHQCNSKKKLLMYEDMNPKSSVDDQVQLIMQETISSSFSKEEEEAGDWCEWEEFAEMLNQKITKDGDDDQLSYALVEYGGKIAASSVSQEDDQKDMIIISACPVDDDHQLKASSNSAAPEQEEEEDNDDDTSRQWEWLMQALDAYDTNLPDDVTDLPLLCDLHIPGDVYHGDFSF